MKSTSLDLSEKIDPGIVSVLEAINDVALSMEIPFFVIGATARDVILGLGLEIETGRATLDIDLAVQVSNWPEFEKLSEGLIATGHFSKTKAVQRLIFKNTLPLDIVPFGSIASPEDSISWPPDNEPTMSVVGFRECYEHSVLVRLRSKPDLYVRFASPGGLAIMKLLSWEDNYPNRRKDAQDLFLIMRTYCDAVNLERLYEENADILEIEGIDFEIACARLLGRDIGQMLAAAAKGRILEILENETKVDSRHRLVGDIVVATMLSGETEGNISDRLHAIKLGIMDSIS